MIRSLVFLQFLSHCLYADIKGMYLSWHTDPTSTMDITWISSKEDDSDSVFIQRTVDQYIEIVGTHKELEDYTIHYAEIKDLDPDHLYQFHFAFQNETFFFKTAPKDLSSTISFISGGDAFRTRKLFQKMNEVVVEKDPLFCVIGGDIAYAIGNYHTQISSPLKRWLQFFSLWKEQLITKQKRVIPLLIAPGNHDVSKKESELFFTFFPQLESKTYQNLVFSDYLQLLLLDTNHFSGIEGTQTDFLEQSLRDAKDILYSFPIYHEDAYPSVYSFDAQNSKEIRNFWCPLFEKYQVSAVFENHSHAFKRTYPIKANKIDPKGIVYLGDGCWGVNPRKPNNAWYIAQKARKNNVYLIELSIEAANIQAVGLDGKVFDDIQIPPRN